jgi:hypothetical protein
MIDLPQTAGRASQPAVPIDLPSRVWIRHSVALQSVVAGLELHSLYLAPKEGVLPRLAAALTS